MRTYLLTGVICLACTSFLNNNHLINYRQKDRPAVLGLSQDMFNLAVHRLSGDRVMISWHYESEPAQTRFEVMRKHGLEVYSSLGVVEPKPREDNSADYSFIDINVFEDSSFYCVKKTDADGVVFFSIGRGIEGVGRRRGD